MQSSLKILKLAGWECEAMFKKVHIKSEALKKMTYIEYVFDTGTFHSTSACMHTEYAKLCIQLLLLFYSSVRDGIWFRYILGTSAVQ